MARNRCAPNYPGALAQPIYVEDHYKFTGPLGQPNWEPDVAEISKRAEEKLWLLFEHYKIDPSDEQRWRELALSLALEHVPGLRFANRPKRGRKPTWKTGLGDELVRAVDDVKSRTGKSTKEAIAALDWEKWGGHTFDSLGARYREARVRQKASASLQEDWSNGIDIAISRAGHPPRRRRSRGGTKRSAKTSRRRK